MSKNNKKILIGIALVFVLASLALGRDTKEKEPAVDNIVKQEEEIFKKKQKENQIIEPVAPIKKEQPKQVAIEKPKEEVKTPIVEDTSSEDALVAEAKQIIQDSVKDIARVDYNKESGTFLIIPTSDSFKMELLQVQNKSITHTNDWKGMVEGFRTLSVALNQSLPGKSIALVNPFNQDNHLLLLLAGTVVYDFTDEL